MHLRFLEPVPFTIDNESHLGLSETQGLLSCDGRNLIIEFQIADTVIGAWKGQMKQISIPLTEVYRIRFLSRFFGFHNRLTLHSRSQELLRAIPDAKQGQISATIKRANRSIADEFCLEVSTAIQRARGEAIDEELGKMELE